MILLGSKKEWRGTFQVCPGKDHWAWTHLKNYGQVSLQVWRSMGVQRSEEYVQTTQKNFFWYKPSCDPGNAQGSNWEIHGIWYLKEITGKMSYTSMLSSRVHIDTSRPGVRARSMGALGRIFQLGNVSTGKIRQTSGGFEQVQNEWFFYFLLWETS